MTVKQVHNPNDKNLSEEEWYMLKINEDVYRIHCENVTSLSVNLDYSSRFIWKQEQQNNYKVTERYEYSVNFTSTRYNFIYSTENRLFL